MNDQPSLPDASDIFPQIPSLPSSERAASDSSVSAVNARSEEKALSRNATADELKQAAAVGEHQRDQLFKANFEWIAIIAVWLGALAVLTVGGVWLWHMSAPPRWRWLTVEEVSHLQSILTAGVLVGIAGNHFKKRVG